MSTKVVLTDNKGTLLGEVATARNSISNYNAGYEDPRPVKGLSSTVILPGVYQLTLAIKTILTNTHFPPLLIFRSHDRFCWRSFSHPTWSHSLWDVDVLPSPPFSQFWRPSMESSFCERMAGEIFHSGCPRTSWSRGTFVFPRIHKIRRDCPWLHGEHDTQPFTSFVFIQYNTHTFHLYPSFFVLVPMQVNDHKTLMDSLARLAQIAEAIEKECDQKGPRQQSYAQSVMKLKEDLEKEWMFMVTPTLPPTILHTNLLYTTPQSRPFDHITFPLSRFIWYVW